MPLISWFVLFDFFVWAIGEKKMAFFFLFLLKFSKKKTWTPKMAPFCAPFRAVEKRKKNNTNKTNKTKAQRDARAQILAASKGIKSVIRHFLGRDLRFQISLRIWKPKRKKKKEKRKKKKEKRARLGTARTIAALISSSTWSISK